MAKKETRKCDACLDRVGTIDIPSMTGGANHKWCKRCFEGNWPHTFYNRVPIPLPQTGRTFGVELEFSSMPPNPEVLTPNIGTSADNSLRGDFPIELKSAPLGEEAFNEWVRDTYKRAGAVNWENNQRAGAHLWIGISGWRPTMDLAHYGSYCQELLWGTVPQARTPTAEYHNSGRPMMLPKVPVFTDKYSALHWLYGNGTPERGILHHRRVNDQGHRVGGKIHRYWWMNIHPVWRSKAIEFRLMNMTKLPERIIKTKDMFRQLVEAAERGILRGKTGKDYPRLFEILDADTWLWYVQRCKATGMVTGEKDAMELWKKVRFSPKTYTKKPVTAYAELFIGETRRAKVKIDGGVSAEVRLSEIGDAVTIRTRVFGNARFNGYDIASMFVPTGNFLRLDTEADREGVTETYAVSSRRLSNGLTGYAMRGGKVWLENADHPDLAGHSIRG